MKEELEKSGYQVSGDPNLMFAPLQKYCERKKLDFSEWANSWMWMYMHRQSGVHYYKNVMTRHYLRLTQEGRNLDSVTDRVLVFLSRLVRLAAATPAEGNSRVRSSGECLRNKFHRERLRKQKPTAWTAGTEGVDADGI